MSTEERKALVEQIAAFLRGQKSLHMTFAETEVIAEKLLRFVIEEGYDLTRKEIDHGN
jgi:hypothetical protein